MIEWGGRKWVPGKPQPRKPINDIEELLKPLGEKTRMGNVWGSQILNVQKPVESQGPPVSPTPTPSITPTSTITPTPTLTTTPTTTPTPSATPPPFSPSSLSGLLWWNDYSDSSKTQLSGSAITGMTDSGNGNTYFTGTTVSNSPILVTNATGSTQALLSDKTGSNKWLESGNSFTNPTEYTIVTLMNITATTANNTWGPGFPVSSDNGQAYNTFVTGLSGRYFSWSIDNFLNNYLVDFNPLQFVPVAGYAYSRNTWNTYVITCKQNGAMVDLEYIVNGVTEGTASAVGTVDAIQQNMVISLNIAGFVLEQVMYNRALSGAEQTQVFNYLQTKYA